MATVKVRVFHETMIATPEGSVTVPAFAVADINEDRAAFIVGMHDGEYVDDPPKNSSAPVVIATAKPNQAIVVSTGTWTGQNLKYSYQWMLNEVPIEGETTNSYLVRPSDVGYSASCNVTATNLVGSATAKTNYCAIVPNE